MKALFALLPIWAALLAGLVAHAETDDLTVQPHHDFSIGEKNVRDNGQINDGDSAPQLSVICDGSQLCDTLKAILRETGINTSPVGPSPRLRIIRTGQQYWHVTRGDPLWIVSPISGPGAKEWYLACDYKTVLTNTAGDVTIFEDEVTVCQQVSPPDLVPPPLPSEADHALFLGAVVAGLLGRFDGLATMIASDNSNVSELAMSLIAEIGDPAAIAVLEECSKNARSRGMKRKLKDCIKDLKD